MTLPESVPRTSTSLGVRHLRYALAVADAGGFRAAAQVLNISQPAITKTVSDIESEFGATLFERGPRGVSPTEAGHGFLADARRTLAMFDRTIRAARRNERGGYGHLVAGYSALATSPRIFDGLRRFEAARPGVQLEMHMRSTDAMVRDLCRGVIDVGFVLEHASVGATGLEQRALWSSDIGLVVPREFAGPVHLEQAGFVMGVRENWRSWRALLDEVFVRAGIEPCVVEEIWDVQVIFQRVAEGRGFTFYPASAKHSLPAFLRFVPLPELEARMSIAMVWSVEADTALLRAFRDGFAAIDVPTGPGTVIA